MKIFVNWTTISGVIVVIVGAAFAGILYGINPTIDTRDFVMDFLRLIIGPMATALIVGGPLKQIANDASSAKENTNGSLQKKLDNQTSDIVNQLSSTSGKESDNGQ